MNPSISVIVTSYNYGHFLPAAIDSILQQDKLPEEVIIFDDGSCDGTTEVANDYQTRLPKLVKFYRNEKNQGIIKTFNEAVGISRGDYICFLGGDNLFGKNYLRSTSKVLDDNPHTAIAYTDYILFGARANKVYQSHSADRRKGEIPPPLANGVDESGYLIEFPPFSRERFETEDNFIHGSSMYRRSAFEEVGGYLSEGVDPEDYNLFKRMINAGWNASKAEKTYLLYRQHSENQANIQNQTKAQLEWYKAKHTELVEELEKAKIALAKKDREIDYLHSKSLTSIAKRYLNRIRKKH